MFEKEKKYFPIKQKPACQLKWTWTTLSVTRGMSQSCHRCEYVPLDIENFENFHNHPFKIREREIMLSGKWPTKENGGSGHCEFCKKIEDNGGTSDRMQHLTIPNLYPKELDTNVNATRVTPKILEIFLNDTCNLKCTYCNTKDSSQIAREVEKFGPLKFQNGSEVNGFEKFTKHPNSEIFLNKTLEWLQKNMHELRRLHLLGGETFYQKELDQVLEVLSKNKNPHLEFNIVSNLMVKQEKFKITIEKIKELVKNKNIGRFDLTASIDGWGPEAEYARTGLKCDHWYELFKYCVNEKWIVLNTNQTITSLTVKSIPELLKMIKHFKKTKNIETHFGLVINRDWMLPGVFGKKFWEQDFRKIFDEMSEKSERERILKNYMKGIFNQLPDKSPNFKKIKILKYFLDSLDLRRGTNWRTIYPYLDI